MYEADRLLLSPGVRLAVISDFGQEDQNCAYLVQSTQRGRLYPSGESFGGAKNSRPSRLLRMQ
jgi:hypothetical protein